MNLHRLVVTLACAASLLAPARGNAEPDVDMPGRLVVIKPPRKLFKLVSRAETEFALPSSSDPRSLGGSLVIRDAGGSQVEGYTLPASGWKGLGDPAQGFRYKGTGGASDPCRFVLLRKRLVKAVCQGDGVTLTTPFLGDVQVGVTLLGTFDSKRYCARFGGAEAQNDDALLRRSNAPAVAASCPTPLPTTTTTTLPFQCFSEGMQCGLCGGPLGNPGFCVAHIDPDPPNPICANSSVCTPGACASDADCSGGQLCVQNPFPPGEIVCCSPCP